MADALFVVFPCLALTLALVGGLYRYFTNRFTYSSLSSQLLENRKLLWGSVPWHYGIILILLAHLGAGLFPRAAAIILGGTTRRLILELAGMALGLFTLWGIGVLIVRRLYRGPVRAVTSAMDAILLFVLFIQVASGVMVAMFQRWGGLWYLYTAVPWFRSIVTFRPDPATVLPLPGLVQMHMTNGFLVILLFPFTRLVHIFTVPVSYLWRPYQVVVWNRDPRRTAGPAKAGK